VAGVVTATRRLVRELGPTGWAILEVLRAHSRTVDGAAVVELSIRALAGEVGLSKNTVQRAVRRLRALGLLEARQARTASGTFAAGHYVLTTAEATVNPSPVAPAARVRDRDRVTPSPHRSVRSVQLSLDV
jgi:DNA-binding IclR family transcriptional regulator